MITWKNTQFNNNPNGMNELIQWKGEVNTGCYETIEVFGFTEGQIIDVARQFKNLEPKADIVTIYGPADFLGIRREYVRTVLL